MAAMASPRGRQTMLDDQEIGAMPELNLNSPRIQAALRVTGIDPDDLRPKPVPKAEPSSPRAETQAWKRKLQETKRRQLAREVVQQASALTSDDVEVLLADRSAQGRLQAGGDPNSLEAERAKIAKLRDNVKSTLQKEVQKEMIRHQKHVAANEAQKEFQARLQEKAKEQQEEYKKKSEEKAKAAARMEEKLKAARVEEVKRRREVQKKIEEKDDYTTTEFARRSLEREEADRERHRRNAEIAERNMQHWENHRHEKLQKQEVNKARDLQSEGRLQKREEDLRQKAEEQRQKFEEKRIHAIQEKEKRQQELEAEFLAPVDGPPPAGKKHFRSTLAKHEKSCEDARALQVEQVEELRSAREKVLNKLTSNREALRQEQRKRVRSLRKQDMEHTSKSLELRDSQLGEKTARQLDLREGFGELVSQNRARIARSDECAREQTLTKIEMSRARLEAIEEGRKRMQDAQVAAVREQMVGQTRIEDLRHVMRDGSQNRVNKILGELAIPLLPVEPGKEGEEGEGQNNK